MRSSRLGEHASRAAATYAAAADHYTVPALGFWDRLGTETVRRLGLSPGSVVLDVCCGAGASALPAARRVGPGGRVVGVDVAEPLLQIARQRAAAEGLEHVEFRCADAMSTGLPDASFDAVVCVFGVFFAADMVAFVREMTRLTHPGGTVAVTTWGPGLFEPANTAFWEAVRGQQPELYKAYNRAAAGPRRLLGRRPGLGLPRHRRRPHARGPRSRSRVRRRFATRPGDRQHPDRRRPGRRQPTG